MQNVSKNHDLYSKPINKKSVVQNELAKYFLTLEINDLVKNVRDHAKDLKVSIGLISETISSLENAGAIE
jgi:hypothetical protein